MEGIEQFAEHFVLLLEAGFIAVNHADEDSATKLFKASQLLKPDNTLPKLGLGYLHLHKLELTQACQMFEEILNVEPSNSMAKALLGMSLSLTSDKVGDGEKILNELATGSDEKEIKNLASDTMDFVERFVKKAPSPADMQKRD